MHAKEFVSAVAAFGLISGAAALGCKDDPVEVKSQADATVAGACKSIDHDLIIDVDEDKAITFGSMLKEVKGNFIVKDNKLIQSLDTQSLETIGGTFELNNLISLVSLSLPNLEEVGAIKWTTLNALDQPTFGKTGITSAKSVIISDTTIPSLDGINVQNLADMDINNNRQLAKFSSSIKTLSNAMYVTSNALNMSMELPNLEWIANMTINNVSTFAVPSLKAVNGSMRFNSNYFSNFLAPNLTMIQEGDLSFVNNPELQNISLPLLKTIGGGLTIANNTGLGDIDGLDSLDRVGGAILLRGSFESFELPKLRRVVGAADVRSTQDITKSCDKLAEIEGQVIQGGIKFCKGNDTKANDATSSDGADDSNGGSKGDDDKSAASLAGASMSTVVTLAALGGLIAAFL